MSERNVKIFWGAALVLVGLGYLATGANFAVISNPYLGLALNGGLSALFFASYFVNGTKRWGWLFPACIFAGAALVIALSLLPGEEGAWISAPVFLSVAAPFLVAYLQDRQGRRWALIPVYAMAALTLITLSVDWVPGELIGTLVLLVIALPFLAIYLMRPERKWALIPFGVLVVISIIPALVVATDGGAGGATAMLFLLAIPFVVVYVLDRRNWWALIPAGGLATIGLVVWLALTLLEGRAPGDQMVEKVTGGALFLGWGLTFLVLWLRRASAPTAWAIYPALVLGLLALATFLTGEQGLKYAFPLAVITSGALLLYNAGRRRLAQ